MDKLFEVINALFVAFRKAQKNLLAKLGLWRKE